jgi:hypothetical protein
MAVCDVCSKPLDPTAAYALTTDQVTTDERYWDYMLKAHSFSDDEVLNMYVQQQAMQRTGWLVCEPCSGSFNFDRSTARSYASRMQDPPGSGPADVQKVAVAAARAWKKKHGQLPSWVR